MEILSGIIGIIMICTTNFDRRYTKSKEYIFLFILQILCGLVLIAVPFIIHFNR